MSQQIIECVPNISEGRDLQKINTIAAVVETVAGVKLLDVDPGKATNRTVITFVGAPDAVIEAAFLLIKKAAELIDMSKHSGEHPRMGATDVCPLVPVSGISMEEVVKFAHQLGERVGKELGIPGYYYEYAATSPSRKNLAEVRKGEYEGLEKKLIDPKWKPDFGPASFDTAKFTGATAISARDFLIAYNINLNTTSSRRANAVAFDIRERGRVKREGNPLTGKIVTDENGEAVHIPGTLKAVKGIGWFIEEYGIAQISLNLTNINLTPIHLAFEEAVKKSEERGLRVTGSELVGLIPLNAMLAAGKYFLKKQERSCGIAESEIIKIAVKSMGLDELSPFNPDEKIIEYQLAKAFPKPLAQLSLKAFSEKAASEAPAPGGGSVAAYVGSLGAALGTMVANLSSHKRGWDDKWEFYSNWAEKGEKLRNDLLDLVDADTEAFNKIMEAFQLPKNNNDEISYRNKAIQTATLNATIIPLKTMKIAFECFEVLEAMLLHGMQSSLSDAGVGAACVRTAVLSAHLNVKINAKDLKDLDERDKILTEAQAIWLKTAEREANILKILDERLT